MADFSLVGCGSKSTMTHSRPQNVPADAWWSGGPDGGAWIQLQEVRETDFTATIFDDGGSTWAAGQFIATAKPSQPLTQEWLRRNLTDFDGRQIFVRNQSWSFKLAAKGDK